MRSVKGATSCIVADGQISSHLANIIYNKLPVMRLASGAENRHVPAIPAPPVPLLYVDTVFLSLRLNFSSNILVIKRREAEEGDLSKSAASSRNGYTS